MNRCIHNRSECGHAECREFERLEKMIINLRDRTLQVETAEHERLQKQIDELKSREHSHELIPCKTPPSEGETIPPKRPHPSWFQEEGKP